MTDQPSDRRTPAELAGWNPDDGEPPYQHGEPPPIDPELGHNGIPPTDAPRIA